MNIEKRKNTTETALKQVFELLKSVSTTMSTDISNFSSEKFYCVYDDDNGKMENDFNYVAWTNTQAKLKFKNGSIKVISIDTDRENNHYNRNSDITEDLILSYSRPRKFDFQGFMAQLGYIVQEYNKKTLEKEAEISHFLQKCEKILNI